MKKFLDENFLLENDTAEILFHEYAETQPVFDFHNHLSPREIYENRPLGNLANAWLDHDHYKWRAMRAAGVPESLITGHLERDGSVKPDAARGGADAVRKADFERYMAFVRTLQGCAGNPLYHWSHLELARYFGVTEPVTEKNAAEIWEKCNSLLLKDEFCPRALLEKMNVKALCTTDDPLDDLEWHKRLAADWKNVRVLPSFRPDMALAAGNPDFPEYMARLQEISGVKIGSIGDMICAFAVRMDYFKSCGALVSDHSLEGDFYLPASADDAGCIFERALLGKKLSHEEIARYRGYVLTELGKLYARKGFVMQIHIGALRDNYSALLSSAGKNIGEDSLQDFNYAAQLGAVLDGIYSGCISGTDGKESAPNSLRVILYNLNPRDNEAVATMAANYRNCVFGPAWWFNDHKDGIEEQIRVFARTSVLGTYVGMLTDSRSFQSYPRHEYFRRILCNFIGTLVDNGEFPDDIALLGKIVRDISFWNSNKFFGLNLN